MINVQKMDYLIIVKNVRIKADVYTPDPNLKEQLCTGFKMGDIVVCCDKIKPITEFYKHKTYKTGYTNYCKECIKKVAQLYNTTIDGKAELMLKGCISRAKERGGECTITKEWILNELNKGFCPKTGVKYKYVLESNHPDTPSIDRIDIANNDYSQENSICVCWGYNRGKFTFTEKEYDEIAYKRMTYILSEFDEETFEHHVAVLRDYREYKQNKQKH